MTAPFLEKVVVPATAPTAAEASVNPEGLGSKPPASNAVETPQARADRFRDVTLYEEYPQTLDQQDFTTHTPPPEERVPERPPLFRPDMSLTSKGTRGRQKRLRDT